MTTAVTIIAEQELIPVSQWFTEQVILRFTLTTDFERITPTTDAALNTVSRKLNRLPRRTPASSNDLTNNVTSETSGHNQKRINTTQRTHATSSTNDPNYSKTCDCNLSSKERLQASSSESHSRSEHAKSGEPLRLTDSSRFSCSWQ